MKTVKFLNGWKKNFITIFLEHFLFKNEKDEIDKITKIISIFSESSSNIKMEFNIEKDDPFSKEFLSNKNYNYKITHTGKKLFSKKEYKLIEMNGDISLANQIIALTIKYKNTIELKINIGDQILLEGVLFGDAGGSHTVHFNTKFFNTEEVKIKVNNIFK